MKLVKVKNAFENGIEGALPGQTPSLTQIKDITGFPFLEKCDKSLSWIDAGDVVSEERQPELTINFTEETNLDQLTKQMRKVMNKMNEQVYHVRFKAVGADSADQLMICRGFNIRAYGDDYNRHPKLVFSGNTWVILQPSMGYCDVGYIFKEGTTPDLVLEACRKLFGTSGAPKKVDVVKLKSRKVDILESIKEEKVAEKKSQAFLNALEDTSQGEDYRYIFPDDPAVELQISMMIGTNDFTAVTIVHKDGYTHDHISYDAGGDLDLPEDWEEVQEGEFVVHGWTKDEVSALLDKMGMVETTDAPDSSSSSASSGPRYHSVEECFDAVAEYGVDKKTIMEFLDAVSEMDFEDGFDFYIFMDKHEQIAADIEDGVPAYITDAIAEYGLSSEYKMHRDGMIAIAKNMLEQAAESDDPKLKAIGEKGLANYEAKQAAKVKEAEETTDEVKPKAKISPADFAEAFGATLDSRVERGKKERSVSIGDDGTAAHFEAVNHALEPDADEADDEVPVVLDLSSTMRKVNKDKIPPSLQEAPEILAALLSDEVFIGDYAGSKSSDNRYMIPASAGVDIVRTVNINQLAGVSLWGSGSRMVIKRDTGKYAYIVYKRTTDNGLYIVRLP